MIALEKANNILDNERLKYRNGQSGAVYVNPSNELITAEENKNIAIKSIEKYYKKNEENGLNEPLPEDSLQHGQVIEYEVSKYTQVTFESLRDEFLDEYNIMDERVKYVDEILKESKNYLKNIECYKIDLVALSKKSISKNEFNFELFYKLFMKEKKGKNGKKGKDPFNQVPNQYEKLAEIIAYTLFVRYLKNLKLKVKPPAGAEDRATKKVKQPTFLVMLEVAESINSSEPFLPTQWINQNDKHSKYRKAILEKFGPELWAVVDAALAHSKSGPLGGAYDRAEYLVQRAAMMQTWADYLDKLRIGADVVPLRPIAA